MKVKLKALSPIFIGGGEGGVLSPRVDCVIKKEEVLLIDQNKLLEILHENENLIDDYVKLIKDGRIIRDFINDLVQKYKVIEKKDLMSLIKAKIPFKISLEKEQNIQIQRFISSPLGHYIPGSSVKGAIRTAIAYCYFRKNKRGIDEVLKSIGGDRNPKFAYINSSLQFETFSAKFAKRNGYDAKDDFLKVLRVRDSDPISQDYFKVFKCSSFHLKRRKEGAPMFLECLDEGKEVELDIRLFKGESPIYKSALDFWDFLKSRSDEKVILHIFKLLNEFAKDFISHEKNALKERGDVLNFYKELENYTKDGKSALILLGKGTTFFGKTVDMVFKPEEIEKLRDCFRVRQMGVIEGKKSEPFPITRLFWHDGRGFKPLGWGLLTLE